MQLELEEVVRLSRKQGSFSENKGYEELFAIVHLKNTVTDIDGAPNCARLT